MEQKHFRKAPIFIGGCGRSGTTLLLAILSAHPKLFAIPVETDAFTHWQDKEGKPVPVRMDRFYWQLLQRSVPEGVTRWCEKRPGNVHTIREILAYFGPEARFIHIVRDPRAVCTSMHPRTPGEYWITVDRYVRDVRAGLAFKEHPQVYTLKYELLIRETDRVIRSLCNFLDEEPHPHILEWYRYARVRDHRAWKHSLKRISSEPLNKWRLEAHDGRVREIMENREILELMELLHYPAM